MVCLLSDFQILLTVFNQSHNCQTSHYLGRNRLLKTFLILPSLVWSHSSLLVWKKFKKKVYALKLMDHRKVTLDFKKKYYVFSYWNHFGLKIHMGHHNGFHQLFYLLFNISLDSRLKNVPQCARTDLNKRFLPEPMTTTGWKVTP